jgi:exopolyphosphatase/guanosine-5'-triphosphate,3'-diphosphate pyrophosphatase
MDTSRARRLAVIDLGSNTSRLVIFRATPGHSYRLVDQVREVVRLRQGMTAEGMSESAMARAFSTLRLFKRFCDSTRVDKILPIATSAVREAVNGPVFVQRVAREIGISLRVLDGEREAYYDTIGALNEVPLETGTVVDIGGGSVQISDVRENAFHAGVSLTLGALALTEKFVECDPVSEEESRQIASEIARQLDTVTWLPEKEGNRLIGLGGTIRNLARIEAERVRHPLSSLHGFTLGRESVEESIHLFRDLPLNERKRISGLNSDRADIILPGAMVLLAIMDRIQVEEVAISENGVREGVFFEWFWQHLPLPIIPDVRRFSVLNLARNYNYEEQHANHVRFLAGRLFDQLAPLHDYGSEERELLDAAALLHDLGRIVGYSSHHKHSQTLIEYSGLPGFSPRESGLIALLTRYHRKGDPDISDYDLLLNDDDRVRLVRLAAILRVAECLERGRNADIDDVIATWSDRRLRITLISDEYPAVELWQAERNAAELMEDAFGRTVSFDSFAPPLE